MGRWFQGGRSVIPRRQLFTFLQPHLQLSAVVNAFFGLLYHLQYASEDRHLAGDSQHSFLLEAILLFCFSEQNCEGRVTQTLGWDHESLHLLSDTHNEASLWDVPGEGEGPLQEPDALAAAIACNCKLLPFLQHLLVTDQLGDLAELLGVHGCWVVPWQCLKCKAVWLCW